MCKISLAYLLGSASLFLSTAGCLYDNSPVCELYRDQCKPNNFKLIPEQLPPIRLGNDFLLKADLTPYANFSNVYLKFEQLNSGVLHEKQVTLTKFGQASQFQGLISLQSSEPGNREAFLAGQACLSVAGSHGEAFFGKKAVTLTDRLQWEPGGIYTDADDPSPQKTNHFPWPLSLNATAEPGKILLVSDGKTMMRARQLKRIAYPGSSIMRGMTVSGAAGAILPLPTLDPIPTMVAGNNRLILATFFNNTDPSNKDAVVIRDCPASNIDLMTGCLSPMGAGVDTLPGLLAFTAELKATSDMTPKLMRYIFYVDFMKKIYYNTYLDGTENLRHDDKKYVGPPLGAWTRVLLALGNLGTECRHCLVASYNDDMAKKQQIVIYSISDTDGSLSLISQPELQTEINAAFGSQPIDALALGDVTQDGTSEVFAARYDSSSQQSSIYSVLKTTLGWQPDTQTRDGKAESSITFTSTVPVHSITVGNMDPDDKADLAFAIPAEKKIVFYLNKLKTAESIACQ